MSLLTLRPLGRARDSVAPQLLSMPTLLGAAVMLLGLTVLCGWLLQVRAMVEFHTGLVAMTFNTALCFTLAGAALVAPALCARPLTQLQRAAGAAIFTLCALILVEHAFDKNLGIDWAFLHSWLQDGNTRPGRLAPNTAIGFMLAGSCLMLKHRIASKAQVRLYQILVFCLMAVGLTGLVGYLISPDQLFGWARSARMAVHTASAMVVLSFALWSSWDQSHPDLAFPTFGLEERIGFMSAAILCVATLTAGLTGFVFQHAILETSLRDKLVFRLEGQRSLTEAGLAAARAATALVAQEPHLLDSAARLASNPGDRQAEAALAADMAVLVRSGFHSALLYSLDGTLLHRAGDAAPALPDRRLPLPSGPDEQSALVWSGRLQMASTLALMKNGAAFARLDLTRNLDAVQAQLFDMRGIGATGNILLCAGQPGNLLCLPSAGQQEMREISRTNLAGVPYPMAHAVDGRTGVTAVLDNRGVNVMAAYAPVLPNIGMVVKQDLTELYGVVRTQLAFLLPALVLLLVLAALLMRLQIQPLVARLVASERRARDKQLETDTLVASVGEGIFTLNANGDIESFNAAASQIFGYSASEVVGRSFKMLMSPGMGEPLEAGMRNYLLTGERNLIGRSNVELPGLRRDGVPITLELTVNEISFDARRVFVCVVRDITARKQVEAKLIQLAQYDLLTGLPNRALFLDRLAGATARSNRHASALAVLFLDLDGFKCINDKMGHHSGDEVLRQFARRLAGAVRKCDTVARLAGDEFTIVLEELADPYNDVCAVAEKIIAAMHAPFVLDAGQVALTTSIGVAIHKGAGADVDQLLRQSDDAMYRAKSGGKNCWST